MRWNLSSNIRCKIRFFNVFLAPFTQKRFGHGTACVWNGATFFRDGTARLHFSFCRACLKIGTGPSTGAILTAHTDFFPRHGTVERFHGWHVFTAERLHGWAFTRLSAERLHGWHGTTNRGAETNVSGSARQYVFLWTIWKSGKP